MLYYNTSDGYIAGILIHVMWTFGIIRLYVLCNKIGNYATFYSSVQCIRSTEKVEIVSMPFDIVSKTVIMCIYTKSSFYTCSFLSVPSPPLGDIELGVGFCQSVRP